MESKREQQQEEERQAAEFLARKEDHERQMWQEKFEAELEMTHKRLELEKIARSTTAKLPKLRITPFKGTPTDWVRFSNMFVTQVHAKSISAEEKFGYLLEMVSPKVRESIANLKPGEMGYKVAWERLQSKYGQTKLVIIINAHVNEIVNLPVVRGTNYAKIHEFYEKVSKNFDALLTLGEAEMLRGFVMMTLNKLPHMKPDLVHTDDNWESWDMEAFIDGLKKWLKRHNTEERPGDSYKPPLDPFRPPRDRNKDEKHWFIKDDAGKDQVDSQRNKGTPWGNFISSEAVNQLKLNLTHHETRQMVTLNGTKRQSMPIFHIAMDSLDGKTRERIEVTGSKMPEFATVRRPDMNELKFKYEHARDKKFYVKPGDEHKIDIILGDNTYCKIKAEKIFKGNPGEPIVEGTTFGWVIHGGDDHVTDQCTFMRETSDYEKLYSLDVLGVQDRGENDQLDVLKEFKDDIRRREDGRYEVRVP